MLSPEQRACLLDIAYAGCHRGLVEDARLIYAGVLAETPGFAPALIGQALSHLVIGEYPQAEEVLHSVLATNENDLEARALMGLCALLNGRAEEARTCLAAIAGTDSPGAVMAAELLASLG